MIERMGKEEGSEEGGIEASEEASSRERPEGKNQLPADTNWI